MANFFTNRCPKSHINWLILAVSPMILLCPIPLGKRYPTPYGQMVSDPIWANSCVCPKSRNRRPWDDIPYKDFRPEICVFPIGDPTSTTKRDEPEKVGSMVSLEVIFHFCSIKTCFKVGSHIPFCWADGFFRRFIHNPSFAGLPLVRDPPKIT